MRTPNPLLLGAAAALSVLPTLTVAKAILGVDLGSLYMKVALVQRNSPLEIVTNLHSKRKTEQMILFDSGTRFFGSDASSLKARKPHLTPEAMSIMLGRDADHPSVQVLSERHFQHIPSYNETRSGVCLTIDGTDYTPEELVAMVLSHAKDITTAYGVTTPVKDCVLTVPAFYTQHERRALLNAAELADLNVLALINENTAAALHFGIDRIDEEPKNYLFYNMGAGSLQVSVVRYLSYPHKATKYGKEKTVGAFEVLGSGWDTNLGGASFDARLVDHMALEFNEIWNKKRNDGETKDVRTLPRPMAKLRIQANKVKHVLSANNDIPVFIDALHDDVNYQTHISRAKFDEVVHDLLDRAAAPIDAAMKMANVTFDEIDAVEMIGGAMRVPRVQEAILGSLGGGLKLGMHLNSDESMALGAAFHGANVSTSFKVRHVGLADVNPFPISVDLTDLTKKDDKKAGGGLFGIGRKKKDEADSTDDEWNKHATVFKLGSKLGSKKTIAFSYEKDVHVSIDYEESDTLPIGTGLSIEQYDISGVEAFAKEMAEKDLGTPKVSLQFELSSSGLAQLVKAEATVEELVMVDEEVEIEDDEEDAAEKSEEKKDDEKAEEGDKAKEGDVTTDDAEKKEANVTSEKSEKKEEKKKKTKMVQKEKKKKHVRTLDVNRYNVGRIQPYSPEIMAESKAKLATLAQKDKERMMLDEAKNTYEGFIYNIRNKLIDDEEIISKVTSEEQRDSLRQSAEDAEEWMYEDGYTADLDTYVAKYKDLSEPAEKIFFRVAELDARPKAIGALTKKLDKVEELMTKWETTMTQVTEDERSDVHTKIEEIRKWMSDKADEQEKADSTGEPVFLSEDVPKQTKKLETVIAKLMKKPKPKPVETKKNETVDIESTETDDLDEKEGEEKDSDTADTADTAETTETAEEESTGEEEEKKDDNSEEEAGDEL